MTAGASGSSVLLVPTAVDTQHPRIACAPSIANAVEELQNLNRALAPDPDGIAKAGRVHGAEFIHEALHHPGKFVYTVAVVEEIVHDLVDAALHHALTQHRPHLVFRRPYGMGEITNPGWVEAA